MITVNEKQAKNDRKRILVIQTAFIGDVILTLPLLQRLKSLFINASIDVIAIPAARNILETIPYIHQLLIYDKRGKDKGVKNFFRYMQILRKNRYQLAVIPHRSLRSAVLASGANIPLKIGFDRSAGRWLLDQVVAYPRNVHEINRNLHLLKSFDININESIFPCLYFTNQDQKKVRHWMEQHLPRLDKIITLAPGSVWATKRWLPESFAGLCRKFADDDWQVVLVGGPADQEVARWIQAAGKVKNIYNTAGLFSLRQSALLIQQSKLLITNDSAPLHLGVAVRTPVAAIFGATVTDFGFYPYGANNMVIENKQLACRPCGAHGGNKCPINSFECMKSITPEQVFKKVQQLIEQY